MHRRKRDIAIELTALLDVIMIMIFMVMNENSKLIEEKQDTLETVQQENIEQAGEIDELTAQLAEALGKLEEGDFEEILDRLQNAESMLAGYQSIDDVVTVINVSLENRYNTRYLTYSVSVESGIAKAVKTEDEFNQAVNEFRMFIFDHTKQISDNTLDSPTVYVVFSYDPGKVYQRDYALINGILEDVEARVNSSNFRYRCNEIS